MNELEQLLFSIIAILKKRNENLITSLQEIAWMSAGDTYGHTEKMWEVINRLQKQALEAIEKEVKNFGV